jgi:hypothetical protein
MSLRIKIYSKLENCDIFVFFGAMTPSIMALSIMTLSIMTVRANPCSII